MSGGFGRSFAGDRAGLKPGHPLHTREDEDFERRVQAAVRKMIQSDPTSLFDPRAFPETAMRPADTGVDGVLESRSGTAQWSTDANGLYVPKSLADAAGDMLVATADNVFARLAKGGNYSHLGVNGSGTVGWKTYTLGRNIGTGGAINKYRAFWATVPVPGSSLASNVTSIGNQYNSGFQVGDTGIYLVFGTVIIGAAAALGFAKNCPNSNVDVAPYLISTHEWSGPAGDQAQYMTAVSLNAGDTLHFALYTGGSEEYSSVPQTRSLFALRIA